jgi:hypothetical protein
MTRRNKETGSDSRLKGGDQDRDGAPERQGLRQAAPGRVQGAAGGPPAADGVEVRFS